MNRLLFPYHFFAVMEDRMRKDNKMNTYVNHSYSLSVCDSLALFILLICAACSLDC